MKEVRGMGKLNSAEEEKPKPNFTHFSHDHPLELIAFCDQADHQKLCSGCKTEIVPAGRNYYTCRACDYSLHHACFNMPRSLQHPADPNHDLDLLLLPSFLCQACGSHGSGFSYSCSICHVHYHTSCTQLPHTKLHARHHHTLELEFSPPYGNPKAFRCDICGTNGSDHWLYRCSPCEFDAHLGCAAAAAPEHLSQPPVSASPSPIMSPPAYGINVKAIAPQTTATQCDGYKSQNLMMHSYMNQQQQFQNPLNINGSCSNYTMNQNGSYMNQPQVQNPFNNGYMTSYAANGTPVLGPSSSVSYAYVNNNPMQQPQAGWAYVNQPAGNYGYNNQGGYVRSGGMVQQGMGYPNQPGVGMGGLVVAGIGTGMGEAVGQGIIHCVTGGFGNDAPAGYSDLNV